MKTYARMVNGLVAELVDEFVTVNGQVLTLEDRYPAVLLGQLVEYDPTRPPSPPPPAPPPAVPHLITMRQARLALLGVGKLSLVDEVIAGLPSPQKEAAQIEWEFASTVERISPLVELLAASLELDAEALDQLFTRAAML